MQPPYFRKQFLVLIFSFIYSSGDTNSLYANVNEFTGYYYLAFAACVENRNTVKCVSDFCC